MSSKRFATHQFLSQANVNGWLPVKGATLIVAPVEITRGTGGPPRY